jgi:hypothetical protein
MEVRDANEVMAEWKKGVLQKDGNKCVNCSSARKVVACFVVPPEAGGRVILSNGVSLCRECRIAADWARVLPQRIDNKTPINFLISKELHETIENYVHNGSRFGSVSALVRHMIASFITEPDLYDDMSLWQDDGSAVKINGWVDGVCYDTFKRLCRDRGISYTDALKSLLMVAVDQHVSLKG